MHGDEHRSKVALRQARERTIEVLSQAFTEDEVSLEDFEARLDRAYRCERIEDLRSLLGDLKGAGSDLQVAEQRVEPAGIEVNAQTAIAPVSAGGLARVPAPFRAILGNVERRGAFQIPSGSRITAIFGNVELDVRDVSFPPGVTEIHARAVFGNIELTVSPQLAVECVGTAVLGSFSNTSRRPLELEPGAPLLRVVGSAVFGNVEIRTKVRR